MTPRSGSRVALSVALGILTAIVVGPALHQGFDMGSQAESLLAAREAAAGRVVPDAGTSLSGDAGLALGMLALGDSVGTWALLHTLGTALLAALGAWLFLPKAGIAGAGAWTLATWATAPVGAAPLVLLVAATGASTGALATHRHGLALAAGVVILSLDPRWALATLPLLLVLRGEDRSRANARGWAPALLTLVVVLVIAAVLVGPGPALERGFLAPIGSLLERTFSGGGLRFVDTAAGGAWTALPSIGLPPTGEDLPPGGEALRVGRNLALRAVAGIALLATLLVLWRVRRATSVPHRLAAALLVATVLALALRGDASGLRSAVLPLVASLLAIAATGGRARLTLALALLLAAPLATETILRTLQTGRDGLQRWEDPRGGVSLTEERIQRWEAARNRLVPRSGEPALVWPHRAGVHWILGTRPAGPVRAESPEDDRVTAAVLDATSTRLVLLGPDPDLLGHRLREEHPRTWNALRDGYHFAGLVRLEEDVDLRLMLPATAEVGEVPLARLLPAIELTVANELSPALRPGLAIGQGVRMGGRDLEGFALRMRTRASDLQVEFRVQVWQRRAGVYDALLASERIPTRIAGDGALIFVRMPVEDSAGKDLALTVELQGTVREEIRLDWYVHDESAQPDFYPQGSALLALDAVDADLYLLVY